MGWFTSGSSCQGNKTYECTYEAFNYPYDRWCRDLDYACPSWDDNGGLIAVKTHKNGGNGGGW